jgi:hypothetical protein
LLFIACEVTPWNRVCYEKPIVTWIVKNFTAFMETKDSLMCSQEPATGPYPEQFVILTFKNGFLKVRLQ